MVGCAARAAESAGQVSAGLDQYPGEPLALGGEHVVFDVIADHQGAGGADAQVGKTAAAR